MAVFPWVRLSLLYTITVVVGMDNDWRTRAQGPDQALKSVKSGMRVFVHGAAATPTPLLEALARRSDLEDVRLFHMHLEGSAPFAGFGKSLRERAEALISIAHPDFRQELRRAYTETRRVVLPGTVEGA
jgi:acyl-CoA hydrolase